MTVISPPVESVDVLVVVAVAVVVVPVVGTGGGPVYACRGDRVSTTLQH